jgi:hypothetical protein
MLKLCAEYGAVSGREKAEEKHFERNLKGGYPALLKPQTRVLLGRSVALPGVCRLRDIALPPRKGKRVDVQLDCPSHRHPGPYCSRACRLGTLPGHARMNRENVIDAGLRHAAERARNSPLGMRQTARELRARADGVSDPCDRAAMLSLASDFESRADTLKERF